MSEKVRELITQWRREAVETGDGGVYRIANGFADELEAALAAESGQASIRQVRHPDTGCITVEAVSPEPATKPEAFGRTVYEQFFHEAVNFIRQRYPEWGGTADRQQTTLTGAANLIAAFVYDREAAGKASH